MDLHDHLVHCGTKTDQCPRCYQFIQRAFFAYHYENNCANINEIEASRDMNKSYPLEPVAASNQQTYPFNKAVKIPCQFCEEVYTGAELYPHQVNIN
jgi:hypothetical protein